MATKKQRIIFSSYDSLGHPTYNGGGALAIHEVAKRLALDNTVIVYCGAYHGARNRRVDGVVYRFIGPVWLGSKAGQLLFPFFIGILSYFVSFDCWFENFTPPFSVSFLPRLTKKPVIGLAHSLSGTEMQHRYHLPACWIENRGLSWYKIIIVSTQAMARQIKSKMNGQIMIIPNGVSLQRYQAKAKTEKFAPYFCFLGRIHVTQKGLDLLLSAFAAIAKQTSAQLLIAGDGSQNEVNKLLHLIEQYDLKDRVILLGRVDQTQKIALLQNSLTTILPSRYESFGLAALETVAAGKRPITFRLPTLAYLVPSVSIKVTPFSVRGLARMLLAVSHDPTIATMTKATQKEFLAKYQWDEIADQYRAIVTAGVPATTLRPVSRRVATTFQ